MGEKSIVFAKIIYCKHNEYGIINIVSKSINVNNDNVNNEKIEGLLVRSATQVSKGLIDACPSLQLIGRGGVGMDNIDVTYAIDKGLHVINTPEASTNSVELVNKPTTQRSPDKNKSKAPHSLNNPIATKIPTK